MQDLMSTIWHNPGNNPRWFEFIPSLRHTIYLQFRSYPSARPEDVNLFDPWERVCLQSLSEVFVNCWCEDAFELVLHGESMPHCVAPRHAHGRENVSHRHQTRHARAVHVFLAGQATPTHRAGRATEPATIAGVVCDAGFGDRGNGALFPRFCSGS